MIKPNILILCTLMTSLFLLSCEEEYVIQNNGFQSKIVVNSVFSPDDSWDVSLTSNRNIHDSNTAILPLESADVVIYNGDGSVHGYLQHTESGNYTNEDLIPEVDQAYKIEVLASGFKSVEARSCVPNKAQIELEHTTVVDVDGVTSVQVDFSIVDQDDSRNNFYVWEVITREVDDEGSYIITEDDEVFSTVLSLDNLVDDVSNGDYQSKIFITDESFQGGSHSTSFLTAYTPNEVSYSSIDNSSDPSSDSGSGDDGGDGGNDGGSGTSDDSNIQNQVFLKVTTVSEELYNYYKSLETYFQKPLPTQSSGKPVEIYSNVTGGLGIFGGFAEVIIEI